MIDKKIYATGMPIGCPCGVYVIAFLTKHATKLADCPSINPYAYIKLTFTLS